MLAPVRVENVGPFFGSNQPISAPFTALTISDQLQWRRSSIFQEALLGGDLGKISLILLIFGESTLLLRLSAELQLHLRPHRQREQGEHRVNIIMLAQLLQAQPDHTTEEALQLLRQQGEGPG